MEKTRFYKTGEVANMLNVSTDTIKRWVRQGLLKARKTAAGRNLISESEIIRIWAGNDYNYFTSEEFSNLMGIDLEKLKQQEEQKK